MDRHICTVPNSYYTEYTTKNDNLYRVVKFEAGFVHTNYYVYIDDKILPYSLIILRGKLFADFVVLRVASKNFILEIFSPPCSPIHFGSVCKSAKVLFLATLLNVEKICPSKYLGYMVYLAKPM